MVKSGVYFLYTYKVAKLPASKRVRFVYALKGRAGEKGMVASLKGTFLAPGCFLLPEKHDAEMQQVFSLWGVRCKRMRCQLIG